MIFMNQILLFGKFFWYVLENCIYIMPKLNCDVLESVIAKAIMIFFSQGLRNLMI